MDQACWYQVIISEIAFSWILKIYNYTCHSLLIIIDKEGHCF